MTKTDEGSGVTGPTCCDALLSPRMLRSFPEAGARLGNGVTGKVTTDVTSPHVPEETGGAESRSLGSGHRDTRGRPLDPTRPLWSTGRATWTGGEGMSLYVLEEEAFHRCCQLLLQWSEHLRDDWSWEPVQGSNEGYLRKRAFRSVVINPSPVWDQEGSSSGCHSWPDEQQREKEQSFIVDSVDADSIKGDIDEDDDDEGDGVCMVSEGSSQVLQYEYHILYSCSYSAPVLYFRAFTLEGRSLALEEVWSSVHPNFRLPLQNSPLNTITQQEHPLLGQPFFMLHPCRTQEFMRPVLQAARDQHRPVNYLLTWLSVVGPLVGLEVPLKYSTLVNPAASLSGTEAD